MDKLKLGWFSELSPMWPGQCMSLKVDEILFHERSSFQDVLVFKSKNYGNVLVLDGVIQCTERDEFSYQEIAAHVPLFSHHKPEKVLVIGGGDGGVIREILKHSSVKSVTICEIDKVVIEVAKKYLPFMGESFNNPRVIQYIGNGIDFLEKHEKEYDVIITDSSDPIGPAACLFEKSYYTLLSKALKDDGIICCQAECMWLDLSLIQKMNQFCKTIFPSVAYCHCAVPTYPSGQIGFLLCSNNENFNFADPCRKLSGSEEEEMNLRYYNCDVHRAAFVLPQFAKMALKNNLPIVNKFDTMDDSDIEQ